MKKIKRCYPLLLIVAFIKMSLNKIKYFMNDFRLKHKFASIITFLIAVISAGTLLPSAVNANELSYLSPEKQQEAQDYAKSISEEALKEARATGAYDYDVARIVGVIIRSIIILILWFIFFRIYKKHFWKHRIARILFIPICLFLSLFLFTLNIILALL